MSLNLCVQLRRFQILMECVSQDLFNIAPKRPNWDLKRELDKKLSKLERKTQESIHTLIRAPLPHLNPV